MHKLRTLHLFSGAGGGILADLLLGHHPVCAVEIEPYCQQVLHARQQDGILPWFPIFADVKEFNGKPWRGLVDVVCGGFPCGDISPARTNSRQNGKRLGLAGKDSGLWKEMCRIVGEIKPYAVQIENSPALRTNGLHQVLNDLASMGYNAKWGVLGVRQFGADHIRERLWIIATDPNQAQRQRGSLSSGVHTEHTNSSCSDWWKNKSGLERVANGLADRVDFTDRLRAIGNGQIPSVAAIAWRALSGELE